MIERLLGHGIAVTAYNRTRSKFDSLAKFTTPTDAHALLTIADSVAQAVAVGIIAFLHRLLFVVNQYVITK
jgi:hypothetical protein